MLRMITTGLAYDQYISDGLNSFIRDLFVDGPVGGEAVHEYKATPQGASLINECRAFSVDSDRQDNP